MYIYIYTIVSFAYLSGGPRQTCCISESDEDLQLASSARPSNTNTTNNSNATTTHNNNDNNNDDNDNNDNNDKQI